MPQPSSGEEELLQPFDVTVCCHPSSFNQLYIDFLGFCSLHELHLWTPAQTAVGLRAVRNNCGVEFHQVGCLICQPKQEPIALETGRWLQDRPAPGHTGPVPPWKAGLGAFLHHSPKSSSSKETLGGHQAAPGSTGPSQPPPFLLECARNCSPRTHGAHQTDSREFLD